MPRRRTVSPPQGQLPPIKAYDYDETNAVGEDTWRLVEPCEWRALSDPRIKSGWVSPDIVSQNVGLNRAWRRARRIIRRAGLDLEGAQHVVFRDVHGKWWAYPYGDRDALLAQPNDASADGPPYWHLTVGLCTADDLPLALSQALGGVGGPFDWALAVLELCERFPESLDPAALQASNFWTGFEIGGALGRFWDFRPEIRKEGLWNLIKKWLMEIQAKPSSANKLALATTLIEERDNGTPLGLKLREHGLQNDPVNLSRHIGRILKDM